MAVSCSVDGCQKPVKAHGWCGMHYQRWLRTGDHLTVRRRVQAGLPEVDRFWGFVAKTDTCWLWQGSKNKGYGVFTVRREGNNTTKLAAHRYAYELLVGPIPERLQLDHLCRVRACVRPLHLEPVTQHENLLRGYQVPSAHNAHKTHCKRGHEFTEANTYTTSQGGRGCRACRTAYYREYRKTA